MTKGKIGTSLPVRAAGTTGLPHGVVEVRPGVYNLRIWALDAPDLEYHADGCDFEEVAGAPTLYFYQLLSSTRLLNMVAISMSPGRLYPNMGGFIRIRETLNRHRKRWYGTTTMPSVDLTSIQSENFRKFPAAIVRAACDDDVAMMDFYSVELLTRERTEASRGFPQITRDCLRIYMTLPVMQRLLELIEANIKIKVNDDDTTHDDDDVNDDDDEGATT